MVLLPEISLHGNNKCHLLQWNSHGLEWVKSQPGSQSDGARILAFMHLPESLGGSYHPRETRFRVTFSTTSPYPTYVDHVFRSL